jgi:adenosylmethionine-8-amino-7-oxononanoate aminotransferase
VFTDAFRPLLFPVTRADAPYCYRCPLGLERASCRIDCLGSLEEAMKQHTVAAVLVEPMLQGAGGMVVWPSEFLAGVRRLCDRYGTLLIADEVLTGFGRTGRMFASEHGTVSPDIICLSKALTAGYLPLGATVTTDRIFEAFLSDDRSKTFFHGHSFTANPLACAVALASLELFREHDVLGRVRRLESRLRAGLMIGGVGIVELDRNIPPARPGAASGLRREAEGYLDGIGPRLAALFLERGLLIRPLGHVLYFMPPYVITDEQVDWALEQITSVLSALDQ